MGSSSTGQRHEVMALNTATNRTSMFIPAAAEVLGLALSWSWYMRTFLSGCRASPSTGWIFQQPGQLLLLSRNADYSPGMEQPESIFPELASGDVFVYPAHPFAFAALLFRLRSAC